MRRRRTYFSLSRLAEEINAAVSSQLQADLVMLEKKAEQLYPGLPSHKRADSTKPGSDLHSSYPFGYQQQPSKRALLKPDPQSPTALLDLITLLYQLEPTIGLNRVQLNYRFHQIMSYRGGFVDPYFSFLNTTNESIAHIIVVKAALLSPNGQLIQKGEVYLETIPAFWDPAIRIAPLLID